MREKPGFAGLFIVNNFRFLQKYRQKIGKIYFFHMEFHTENWQISTIVNKKRAPHWAPWAVYLRFTLLIYNYDGNNIG